MISPRTRLADPTDTIVALSSAAAPGGRAIVRLSGRAAATVTARICPAYDPQRRERGRFVTASLLLPGFHAPIPADVYHFVAPHSYTGQDVIEMHLISCVPIVETLIAQCLEAGARAAGSGEFTLRAFLSGKLDLTRAEAVLGVIEASSRADLTQALKQLAGGIAHPLAQLRDDLLNLLADVEAGLDFTEENIHFVSPDELLHRITRGLAQVTLIKKQLQERTLSQPAFRVVLAGRPNAGKSSLFNALCGRDQALVDAEPGTTRDYLEATLETGPGEAPIVLVDTAGLRSESGSIEQIGQSLAQEQMTRGDLVLWCAACDDTLAYHGMPSGAVPLATQCDRAAPPTGMLATSAFTGQGLDALRRRLIEEARRAGHGALAPSLSRCRHHVEQCVEHLQHAHANVLAEDLPELLALDLRLALEELGAMTGAIYTDDLLDRVFSRFCIGK